MTEDELHRGVVKWLKMIHWRVPVIWFSVPNNPRSRVSGARLKAQGMLAGAPDLVFLWRDGKILIELKRPKTSSHAAGQLSAAQCTFRAACETAGVPYAIARSIEDCGNLLRERHLLK